MQDTPGFSESTPTPPPPPASRKGLWIGLGIGAVVLCLCCILVVVGVAMFGNGIPGLSSLFATPTPLPTRTPIPSPTPSGLTYSNPDLGLSLTYPLDWVYYEDGDATTGYVIMFASSLSILEDTSGAPDSGAGMVVLANLSGADMELIVDPNDMTKAVEDLGSVFVGSDAVVEDLHNFTMNGYPAASGVYTVDDGQSTPSKAYVIAALRDDMVFVFLGVSPESEWGIHQPEFDLIINSVQFAP